jgi:ubiquinone/menaquinone biosynthesis C-methylase UbiE
MDEAKGWATPSESADDLLQTRTTHHATVRAAFTRQARAYAAASVIADPVRIARLLDAAAPAPTACALEVATGPGHVALALASRVRAVVGIDLTPAPLAIAEENRRQRAIANTAFIKGDVYRLPFPDGVFDLVLCRLAVHHFADPAAALAEMARVCRRDGRVVIEDVIVSEHPDRAAYQNRFENLRDESHTRALPLSALLLLFAGAGLEVEAVQTGTLEQELDDWLARAGTPPDRAAQARALIERDAEEDLSGTRPLRRNGLLVFTQRTAIVVGRPLVVDSSGGMS